MPLLLTITQLHVYCVAGTGTIKLIIARHLQSMLSCIGPCGNHLLETVQKSQYSNQLNENSSTVMIQLLFIRCCDKQDETD